MTKPTRSREYELEILTPVHVGSGKELSSRYDYYLEGGKIRVVDMGSVIEALEGNDKAICEFGGEDFNIQGFLQDYSVKPGGYGLSFGPSKNSSESSHDKPAKASENSGISQSSESSPRESDKSKRTVLSGGSRTLKTGLANLLAKGAPIPVGKVEANSEWPNRELPNTIREQLKNGFGRPLIPGSSIKGSIRTAILAELIWTDHSKVSYTLPHSGRPGEASSKLIKAYLGEDANRDILRCLHVGDACFDPRDLCCNEVRWFNLLSRNKGGWRDIQGGTRPHHSDVRGMHTEGLGIYSSCTATIQWDSFLLDRAEGGAVLRFARQRDMFTSEAALAATMNTHATKRLQDEKSFFKRYGLDKLIPQYDFLASIIESKLPECAFVMQLGWGVGWGAMTGNWLKDEELGQMNKLFHMGTVLAICPKCNEKVGVNKRKISHAYCKKCGKFKIEKIEMFEVFPKTRRIVFENGEPCYPMGWVKLTPIDG